MYGLLAVVRLPVTRRWWLLTCATWAALIVPFWLASSEFGPLSNPGSGLSPLVKALFSVGASALALALAPSQPSVSRVLAGAAMVQGALVFVLMIAMSLVTGGLQVGALGYGALAQGCGVLSVVTYLVTRDGQAKTRPSDDEDHAAWPAPAFAAKG